MPHLATRGRARPQTDKDRLPRAVCPCLGRGRRQVCTGPGWREGRDQHQSAQCPRLLCICSGLQWSCLSAGSPHLLAGGQHRPLSGPTSEALAECGGSPELGAPHPHKGPGTPCGSRDYVKS